MVKILKSGRWAVPGQPAAPQVTVKEGEERDDLPAALVVRMIEVGHAEEGGQSQKVDDKPRKKRAGQSQKVVKPEETKVVEAEEKKSGTPSAE